MADMEYVFFFEGSSPPHGNRPRSPGNIARKRNRHGNAPKANNFRENARQVSTSWDRKEKPSSFLAWVPEQAFFQPHEAKKISGGIVRFTETRRKESIMRFNDDGTPHMNYLRYIGAAPRDKIIRLSGQNVRISREIVERLSRTEFEAFIMAVNKLPFDQQPSDIFGCKRRYIHHKSQPYQVLESPEINFAPETNYVLLKDKFMSMSPRPSRPGVREPMDLLKKLVEQERVNRLIRECPRL